MPSRQFWPQSQAPRRSYSIACPLAGAHLRTHGPDAHHSWNSGLLSVQRRGGNKEKTKKKKKRPRRQLCPKQEVQDQLNDDNTRTSHRTARRVCHVEPRLPCRSAHTDVAEYYIRRPLITRAFTLRSLENSGGDMVSSIKSRAATTSGSRLQGHAYIKVEPWTVALARTDLIMTVPSWKKGSDGKVSQTCFDKRNSTKSAGYGLHL